ncbi:MAG: hypothetical protein IH593_02045, partial [Bacteroidales bacterium]|nr:hypothetical protein [Bacteroidales bacterium]
LLAALAVIVSIITLASFMKFQRYAFYNKAPEKRNELIKEVPFPMVFSMVVLGVICLLLSILVFPDIRDAVLTPAANILLDPTRYSSTITGL